MLLVAGCASAPAAGGPDLGAPDGATAARDFAVRPCDGTAGSCPAGYRCFEQQCRPDNGTCASDAQCENDTWCYCAPGGDGGACDGICISWGLGPGGTADPTCHGVVYSSTPLGLPKQRCNWTSQAGQDWVASTPLVIDLDGNGKPEIVF